MTPSLLLRIPRARSARVLSMLAVALIAWGYITTTRMTAEVAKDHDRDADALVMEGDHESSVLPGVKQSVAFFLKH